MEAEEQAAHGQLWDAIRAKGRRVEVIAIWSGTGCGFAGRSSALQLWAAAEPGKVATGLTVKQEISAIREALHNGDREFLGQYGGINQAAERYKELLILPEAELAEGYCQVKWNSRVLEAKSVVGRT